MRPPSAIESWSLCALLLAGSALAAESKVCVPGENRRWLCGSAAEPPSAAARAELPAPPPPPLPPVLLIDPERLYGPAPEAPIRSLRADANADSPVAATPGDPGTAEKTPDSPTAPDRPEPTPRGSHTWQLARASGPAGFAGLLRARGIDPAQVLEIRTRRGDWLLLYGDFPDLETARSARGRAGEGFARAWRDIDAER